LAGHIASSKNQNWCTTLDIVERVKRVFGGTIGLDPCSNEQSIVGATVEYRLPEHDGLVEPWTAKSIYANMPFGRSYMHEPCKTLCIVRHKGRKRVPEFVCPRCEKVLTRKQVRGDAIGKWVARCWHAWMEGAEVIALMPAAVSTKHVQRYVFREAAAICYPDHRIKFGGSPSEGNPNTAPMDIILPYWGMNAAKFEQEFESLGHIDRLDVQRHARIEYDSEAAQIRGEAA
jgi:hypothetical protein